MLPFFLACYVVGSCACRSWFFINSKWNTGPIKFKLMQKVRDACRNGWNKVSQNVTEEFSWKLQWPVYKNNMVSLCRCLRENAYNQVKLVASCHCSQNLPSNLVHFINDQRSHHRCRRYQRSCQGPGKGLKNAMVKRWGRSTMEAELSWDLMAMRMKL